MVKNLFERRTNNRPNDEQEQPALQPAPQSAPPVSPYPAVLPLLPLRGTVVYPMMWLPITVGQQRSLKLVEDLVAQKQRILALAASLDPQAEEPVPDEIYRVGVIARIDRLVRVPNGTVRLILQGLERVAIEEFTEREPYLRARVHPLPELPGDEVAEQALARAGQDLFAQLVSLSPKIPGELESAVRNVSNPRQAAYLIASAAGLKLEDAQAILETDPLTDKLKRLNAILKAEADMREVAQKIQQETQGGMEKAQREFYLRKQMETIQRELGENDEQATEIAEMETRIAEAGMPAEADKEAHRELGRMRRMPIQAAEYSVIKTYLDWMLSLPWQKRSENDLDINHARQVLDEDHYGLEDIKDRILEFLAVRKLRLDRAAERRQDVITDLIRKEREGVILCFVGPPGVGKTSLGLSIARAMNRKFVRLALGGIRDEAEIRGFRRTYIGAMPGRIIQSLRRVESRNPVFMLDEVDKLGRDFRGDPSSALLEVLDPEQNSEFRDHYLDVPFDLSEIFFITTANWLDPIPGPLRDRMEIIELSSYTDQEKVKIAQGFLVPRQIRETGLRPGEIDFNDAALLCIVHDYTREAGVRNLERQIGAICRKVATRVAANGENVEPVHVDVDTVVEWLGKPKFFDEEQEHIETPGIATGLAWTPVGGQVLFVEATAMPGKGRLTLTGQLGNVMKESAMAAVSLVRSASNRYDVPAKWFEEHDLHIHVPSGAQPKDGPSAGIAIATAILSLVTGRCVVEGTAMTGEITLRGRVTRIGGVREKVLAAHRHGLRTVVLPAHNEVDLDEVPENVRGEMTFHFANTIDEAWGLALSPHIVRLPPPGLEQSNGAEAEPAVHTIAEIEATVENGTENASKEETPQP